MHSFVVDVPGHPHMRDRPPTQHGHHDARGMADDIRQHMRVKIFISSLGPNSYVISLHPSSVSN